MAIPDSTSNTQQFTALSGTGNRMMQVDASGNVSATQDASKQDTLVSGTNIKTVNGNSLLGSGDLTVTVSGLTPNRALRSASDGTVAVSATTSDELGFLSGVTSSVQTQLGNKANLAGASFTGDISVTTGGNTTALRGSMLEFQRTTGPSYIDNKGTGQSIIIRTSDAGAVDTNALTIERDGDVIAAKSLSAPTLTATSGFSSPSVTVLRTTGLNANIEIGNIDGVLSTPFIDFHSGVTAVDYDSRIIASGGNGSNGGGTLGLTATQVTASNNLQVTNRLELQRSTGSSYLPAMSFADTLAGAKTDNLSIGNNGGGDVIFFTNATERMRLVNSTGAVTVVGNISASNLSGTNTGNQNIFQTIAVSGQSSVVADTTTDTLTLVAGTNVTITTDASTDTITINATGSGGLTFQETQRIAFLTI